MCAPQKGRSPVLAGYPENEARALGACQSQEQKQESAARHIVVPQPQLLLLHTLMKAEPSQKPQKVPACVTLYPHLGSWPSTDPREQGPQSHGPSLAQPQRPAALFHFCTGGVKATIGLKEGLHLRFVTFLAPPPPCAALVQEESKSVSKLLMPLQPRAEQEPKWGCSPEVTGTHKHTHTPSHHLSPCLRQSREEECLGKEGKAGVPGPAQGRVGQQAEEPEGRSGQAASSQA